jgi:hypothetical protein
MPATVPLATPVTTLTRARAVAESVGEAGPGAPIGPALDRIARFLTGLDHAALLAGAEGVLDVLHLLGDARATRLTGWLATQAGAPDAAGYWGQLHELSRLELAA